MTTRTIAPVRRHPWTLAGVFLVALAALTAWALIGTTTAKATHVDPIQGPNNPQTSNCPAGTTGFKLEPVQDGTFSDGTLTVTIDERNTSQGEVFDFTSNLPIAVVFVKGGPFGNEYVYNPPVTADTARFT